MQTALVVPILRDGLWDTTQMSDETDELVLLRQERDRYRAWWLRAADERDALSEKLTEMDAQLERERDGRPSPGHTLSSGGGTSRLQRPDWRKSGASVTRYSGWKSSA